MKTTTQQETIRLLELMKQDLCDVMGDMASHHCTFALHELEAIQSDLKGITDHLRNELNRCAYPESSRN